MYNEILVAVDGSPVPGRAVLAARDLAQLSSGGVWVGTARYPREGSGRADMVMKSRA